MLFRRSKTLDPTEAAEVAEVRVDGARHIPLAALPSRLGELDPGRPVAFLCRSGSRSSLAGRRRVIFRQITHDDRPRPIRPIDEPQSVATGR